ncbi:helix-turn-helix domain-containing protein [Actinokineospora terrae]|uniref:Helix-turn-helix domain-containing protein n=1 Tax=Actinokineospora terrae TaxID=155974 RepID=A0A1H9M907_9PSEU|nr:helix-turn-helix transcriptional regulator [Actinokineospora terrae]SER20250.1 Helix-turn-helix domain-containing protein [Actinokineospora terrae]
MALSTTPTVIRRYLAFELRRLRGAAGLSQTDAGRRLGTAQSRIAHFESGRNVPRPPDIEVLLPYYGAPDLVDHLRALVVGLRTAGPVVELDTASMPLPPGFDMYVALEQGASRVFTYDAVVIMGLLQCRAYATAAVRAHTPDMPADEVEAVVKLRLRRQDALDRDTMAPKVVAVIDEGVLRKHVGGRAVAAEQLGHLRELAERDNVTILVLPAHAGAHPGFHGAHIRLEFPIDHDPGVVYLEDLCSGRLRDDTDEIDRYTEVERRLTKLALPADQSAAMIDRIREDMSA